MVDIHIKELSCLTLEEIKKHLPTNYKITTLEKEDLGKQKKETFVVGEFYEVQRRKTQLPRSQQVVRFKLKGVLPGNSIGLRFEVVIFGKTVDLIEEALKSIGNSTLWIAFSNLLVVKYAGQEEPWCPFGLKLVDQEENDTNLKQEITLFYHRNKPKELPMKYALLKDIKDKCRMNVFVVVSSIIKQPVVLFNKTKHIMLGLVDSSCSETSPAPSTSASATYQDIPLHIFLNDTQDCFPQPFAEGDILRIRDLLGDLYAKEQRMFGKIYHSKAVVKFELAEDDDKVTPISSNQNYVLTAQDEKIVRELRQWWIKKKEKDNVCVVDPILLEKKICEVTSPCTITLNCLIQDVRIVEAHNVVILRVTDGTKSSVMTTTVNFEDATMELSSQSEQIDTALLDSEEIDITVFEPLIEKASRLKQGDMVQLIKVTCVDIVEGLEALGNPVLDFYMRDEKCEIRKVLENTSIARELLRSLSGKSSSGNEECEVTILYSNVRESGDISSSNEVSETPLSLQLENFNPGSSSSPVKPVEKTTVQETPSPTPSPARSPAPSPVRLPAPSPARSPAPSPARSPAPSPARSPAPSPVRLPAPSPARSPAPSPARSPAPSPARSPAPSPARSPAPSPARSSAPSLARSPTPSPARSSAPSPARTPAPSAARSSAPSPARSPAPSPAPSPARSPAPSPARSPAPSPSLLVNENGRDNEENVPYSALVGEVGLVDSIICNGAESQDHERSCNCNGAESQDHERSCNNSGPGNEDVRDNADCSNRSESSHTSALENSGRKRKCPDQASLHEPRNKVSSFIWEHHEVNTRIRKAYPKMSITDFYEMSSPQEKARVWALLRFIRIETKKSCKNCPDENCYHDWIWGLCSECGLTLSASDLREHFSPSVLITCESLPCFLCSSSSNPDANILPLFKLKLGLEDIINDNRFIVDLCGDHAEEFFNAEPSFKWTVAPVPFSFHCRVSMYYRLNRHNPFQFCLINIDTSDGEDCLQICDTKLNF